MHTVTTNDQPILLPGLSGTSVAVTGGASGIGLATTLLAARSGARVVAGDVNDNALADLSRVAADEGLDVVDVHLDVADPASIDAFLSSADQAGTLRGVVNAAGIADEAPALEVSPELWHRHLAVNLTGTFLVCQGAARLMSQRPEGGSIVNVSSTAGVIGSARLSHYAASKAGVIGLSKSFAKEWGQYGIRVNVVSPGAVDTPLYHQQSIKRDNITQLPLSRIGQPADLALAIGYFLTDQSGWVTGQNLNVNGGAFMQ
jgi:NAD(P)-dependent dehydrogenase (short-subunit alcohol dehydrogenase family)